MADSAQMRFKALVLDYDLGTGLLVGRGEHDDLPLTWYDFSSPAGHPDGTEFKYLILEPEMSGHS